MKHDDAEYLLHLLSNIKGFIQLGCRSEHPMERELFKKINDDFNIAYNYGDSALSKSKDDSTEGK